MGISLFFGLYRGFVTSLLGLVSLFVAMFAAYALGPSLAAAILRNETVVETLVHYTDAASRLGDLDMSQMAVAGINSSTVAEIVLRTDLPAPFDELLKSNITQQVFAALGSVSISEYINQTIVTSVVSILSYLVTFIAAYVALTLLTSLVGYVFRFPSLKQLDAILGGVLGAVRGVFLVYVLFALVPIVMTVVPFEEFGEMVEASRIGSALYNSNIVMTILRGHL